MSLRSGQGAPTRWSRLVAEWSDDPGRARVLFLLPILDVGGAERVVLRTAARLSPRFSPAVAAFSRGSGRLEDELKAAGVPVVHLSSRRRSYRTLASLWWLLRRSRPDVLFTMMFHSNIAGRIVGRMTGVPVIINSERIVGYESRVRVFLNRLTVGLADAVTTNSRAGVESWSAALGLQPSDVYLIHNGIDTGELRPEQRSPGRPVVFGNLARLHPKNGQDTLLHALSQVVEHAPGLEWRCRIGGEGPERDRLERLARDLSLERRVEFAGYQRQPAPFLHSLDVYVQSSAAEGLSNSILEAMACGLPVVATKVGGTAEAVVPDETGSLVAPGCPRDLAAALVGLAGDPARRTRFGQAGRRRVEQLFSLDTMVEQTEQLLDRLLARRGR